MQSQQNNQSRTWAQLSALITASLDAVRAGEFKTISSALIPAMPDVIASLRAIATDPEATVAQRTNAIELLMTMWARCLRGDLRAQKIDTKKLETAAQRVVAEAEKAKARVQDKKLTLVTAQEQKRAARQLKKLKAAQETNVTTN